MTYQEFLQSLADRAATNYTAYLQSKIDILNNQEDGLLADKTSQYKDGYETLEKKFTAVLAMVKNGQSLEDTVPEDVADDAVK